MKNQILFIVGLLAVAGIVAHHWSSETGSPAASPNNAFVVGAPAPASPSSGLRSTAVAAAPSPKLAALATPADTPVSQPSATGTEATVKECQALALRMYPAIGVKGSPENTRYTMEYQRLKTENPAFFGDPSWPITLAKQAVEAPAPASTPADNPQAMALRLFPALGVKGSALNRAFVQEYQRLRAADPGFFNDPTWPLILARRCAQSELSVNASGTGREMVVLNNGVPQSAPVPGKNPSSAAKAVSLRNDWDTPMQGGSQTLDDLATLFSPVAKSGTDQSVNSCPTLYSDIAYLMPIDQAEGKVGVNGITRSKVEVSCPGFPSHSIYYYSYDGHFDGHYNRLYLVVDRQDQVVSVELVDEAPKQTVEFFDETQRQWHCYDFINNRAKASTDLKVIHSLTVPGANGGSSFGGNAFQPFRMNTAQFGKVGDDGVLQIDSMLEKTDQYSYRGKALQLTRWYVPVHFVRLILHCVEKGGQSNY